jgi:VanZ family protein
MTWLRHWWPALAWAAVISLFSTGVFSGANTSRIIFPLLLWLYPHATQVMLEAVHFYVRKSGHFCEFFLFSLLALRGIRAGRPGWRWAWGLAALAVAAGYASLDELHQSFVPSRYGSAYDVLLDSFGAAMAQTFAAARVWRQKQKARRMFQRAS